MPRNIEIKARICSVEALLPKARALAGGAEPVRIAQDDCFFAAAHGRLKLRQFEDGSAELIHYHRPDTLQAKASDYVRVPVAHAADTVALREALTRACGLRGRVVKTRWLLLVGRTRIHLDRVQGLGDFIELEVVLADEADGDKADAQGVAEAEALMHALGLGEAPREAGAYVDLLARAETPALSCAHSF